MVNSELSEISYVIQAGVTTYPIGFEYHFNENNSPQLLVKIGESVAIINVDFQLSADESEIILIPTEEEARAQISPNDTRWMDRIVGKELLITRDIPFVQTSDYSVGRINPEQIEYDFDRAVMRDQEILHQLSDFTVDVALAESLANAAVETANEAATAANQATATANTALDTANTAVVTANEAKTTAIQASQDAVDAMADAASAVNKADAADMTATTAMEIAAEATTIAQGAGAAVANKQDKLVAGQGITIDGNTISATDGYSKTEIDNKVSVIEADIDANADAIQKTRADFIAADSELSQMINAHAAELTSVRSDLDDLGDQVSDIEAKIPGDTTTSNPLVTKSDLSTTEQMIRADVNSQDSMLQTQITAHASAIAGKQDKLSAGENITIVDNVISSTGGGGWNGIRWNKRLMVTMPTQEEFESETSKYMNPYQSMFTTPELEDGDYYFYYMSLGLPSESGPGVDSATFEKKFIINFTVKNGTYYKGSASRVDGFSFNGNSIGSLYNNELTFGVWSHGNGRFTFGSQGWPAAFEGYQYISNLFEQTINAFSLTTIVNKQTDDEYVFESISGQFGWGIYDEHVEQFESYSTLNTISFMVQPNVSTIHLSTLGNGSQNCVAGYAYVLQNGDMAQSGIDLFMRTPDDYHNWVDFHIDVRAKTFTRKIIGSGVEPFNSMNVGFDSANNKVCLFLPDESTFTLSQDIFVFNRFKESSTATWLFSENFSESEFDALEQFTEIKESADSGGGITKEEADATYLQKSGGYISGTLLFQPELSTGALAINHYGLYTTAPSNWLGNPGAAWNTAYIKTINNGQDGAGNITIPTEGGTLARVEDIDAIGGDGTAGQVLTKTDDGMAWQDSTGGGASLPDQTDNAGKFLMTDGTTASWGNALENRATDSYGGIVVGEGAKSATSTRAAVIIGRNAGHSGLGNGAVGIGDGAASEGGINSVSIGAGSAGYVGVSTTIAIGSKAKATETGAIQLGAKSWLVGYTNSDANTFKVGNANGNFEMMDADGNVPLDRLTYVTNQIGDISTALTAILGE